MKANSLNLVDLISFSGSFPVDGRIPPLEGAGEVVVGRGSIDFADMLAINHKVLALYANGMGSRRDLVDMLRFVEANGLAPVIDSTFRFEQAAEAIEYFANRRHVGKVAVTHGA